MRFTSVAIIISLFLNLQASATMPCFMMGISHSNGMKTQSASACQPCCDGIISTEHTTINDCTTGIDCTICSHETQPETGEAYNFQVVSIHLALILHYFSEQLPWLSAMVNRYQVTPNSGTLLTTIPSFYPLRI